ncbi:MULTISPECIES: ABC transporter ATP-binding protein [unclassified Clostridioides]|uniref:ABC transporter ATP-binding protein n=1 Tax=unclassified Clostridioides TaxID=2635829 RepID=UPI001D0C4386|nr:ABC transporter ATP-binding protein [Clostridioides sp. ES-S-0049-02]MCC0708852.1 ABC transporter ATP-binding protein [Clostridioides sp. ES-S-0190-01]MCC0763552.1 ABC transporter ATP-binding protein [Clostridioides sp. ES-S-0006-03]
MNILKTIDLCKIYGRKESRVEVLRNINIEIDKGEFVSIMGPSGSGKSTLLYLLGGIERATSGKIIVDNKDINIFSDITMSEYRRKKIGFVFQQYNLIPILTVEENIKLPLLMGKEKVDENYINELIDMLGLKDKRKSLPSQLSGGQQQRVAIGRALSTSPSIILADEPTGNLDSKNSDIVIDLLKMSTKRLNKTLLLVTHDNNIAKISDRVISIIDGKIKE